MSLHESGEDYLERILILKETKEHIRSIDLANSFGYTKQSISRAVKHLKEAAYITIDENGYIELTKEGLKIASKMYERHVLLSELLENLGVSKETACADACKIEHDLSEETFSVIKKHLKKAG